MRRIHGVHEKSYGETKLAFCLFFSLRVLKGEEEKRSFIHILKEFFL